ncbi:MAG: response regulator, partial [Cognaticolwellia aestuarii]
NVNDFLANLANLASSLIEKNNIEVNFEIDDAVPDFIIGDALRLNQVLLNLLSNAIKFSNGNNVTLKLTVLGQNKDSIDINFKVLDRGIGMSKEQIESLFKPFSQADISTTRKFGGTGLGLVISKKIVELMGSEIRVESHINKGSCFGFDVSLGQPLIQTISTHPIYKHKRALIIEQLNVSEAILYDMLNKLNITTDTISFHDKKLTTPNILDNYDFIFIDWHILNQPENTRLIKLKSQLSINIKKLIILTSFENKQVKDCLVNFNKSADELLLKPIIKGNLNKTLEHVMGMSRKKSSQADNTCLKDLLGAKILLVEDNPLNQQVASQILRKNGFIVDIACDGLEALKAIQAADYDCILMDCQMPNMDGYTAAIEIRKQPKYATIPIIAMTANTMAADLNKAKQSGMQGYIAKPIEVKKMFDVIAEQLGSK